VPSTAVDRPPEAVAVREDDEGTVVDVDVEADRRFGLNRLPQQFVAGRYRREALDAQGYTVVERDASVGL
jgi:hypothetical protein